MQLTDLLIRRQRQVREIPLPDQALGAGFAGSDRESAQVFRVVDVEAMPGNESTTQGLPVAWAAAWWGLKLSLPKRAGTGHGTRKMALVPRLSAAGTSTALSGRRQR